VSDESEKQYEKHFDPRISTFLGIKIDRSDEYENASDSIRVKCEFDSNVIDESDLQGVPSSFSISGWRMKITKLLE
jgi:hypothetical protein